MHCSVFFVLGPAFRVFGNIQGLGFRVSLYCQRHEPFSAVVEGFDWSRVVFVLGPQAAAPRPHLTEQPMPLNPKP